MPWPEREDHRRMAEKHQIGPAILFGAQVTGSVAPTTPSTPLIPRAAQSASRALPGYSATGLLGAGPMHAGTPPPEKPSTSATVHAPAPLQVPPAHSLSGSCPAWIFAQIPAWLTLWQRPAHAVLAHTPSVQKLLWHSELTAQDDPSALAATQTPLEQMRPAAQSADPVHEVPHAVKLAQA